MKHKTLLAITLIAVALTGCDGQFNSQGAVSVTVEPEGVVQFAVSYSEAIADLEVQKELATDPAVIHKLDIQIQELRNLGVIVARYASEAVSPLGAVAATTRPMSAAAPVLPGAAK